MDTTKRSDRNEYGVTVYRGYWVGWYYDREGNRKKNVALFMSGSGMTPIKIPCVKIENPDRCPNRTKAIQEISRIYQRVQSGEIKPAKEIPNLKTAIDKYIAAMAQRECSPSHQKKERTRLEATIHGGPGRGGRRAEEHNFKIPGLQWKEFKDISRREFNEYLGVLKENEIAAATRNKYRQTWIRFLAWAVSQEYIQTNKLQGTERARTAGKEGYRRRSFTRKEMETFLEGCNPRYQLFYMTAAYSGLRYSELRGLRKRHIDLDHPHGPMWKLPAEGQKVKLPQTIPMMPKLAEALRGHLELLDDFDLVFEDYPPYWQLEQDLKDTRIPKKNSEEEHIAFHSFRYFFCTEMSKKLPMTRVQILMRHRKLSLTADLYRKLHIIDSEDIWKVPDIS